MLEEKWTSVLGYENKYEVSNLGRMRSKIAKKPNHIMSLYKRKDGYLQVQLKVAQKPRNYLVHRLVYEGFWGQIDKELVINHKDGVKENNDIFNLEAIPFSANIQHAWDTGLCKRRNGEANPACFISGDVVRSIREEAKLMLSSSGRMKYGACTKLAEKYGISRSAVSGFVHGVSRKEC
jgi:hypothetical protein